MEKENDIIEAEFTEDGKNLPSVESTKDVEVKHAQVDVEFEFARSNIIRIIQTSERVLENTAELVLETEHPRMVEVYSGLIKNLTDINKSLFEIREKKMKIKGELIDTEEVLSEPNIVNNAVFIGSTEELLQKMKII